MKFDATSIFKIVIAAVLSGGAVAGGSFISDEPVSVVNAVTAALTTVLAYLKASPVSK